MERESQDAYFNRQAIERLAQHIPFETDPQTQAELIEMLSELVRTHGPLIDPEVFGFEARQSLERLGLWARIGG